MSVPETMAAPFSPLSVPGLGLATTLQLVPFQCSISVCPAPAALTKLPTAHTSVAETAAAAARLLKPVLALGLGTTLQLVPSQCSISVCVALLALGWKPPTAHTSVPETAVTPFSSLFCVPGLGLGTTLHVRPFQCSVRVCAGPNPATVKLPTAQTSLLETAATPSRMLSAPPGLGLGTTLHLWPFQCSASVSRGLPEAAWKNPTAQTSVLEAALTASRLLFPPGALGLLMAFHAVPFQCRVSVWPGKAVVNSPTAQTSLAETLATPFSSLPSPPGSGSAPRSRRQPAPPPGAGAGRSAPPRSRTKTDGPSTAS